VWRLSGGHQRSVLQATQAFSYTPLCRTQLHALHSYKSTGIFSLSEGAPEEEEKKKPMYGKRLAFSATFLILASMKSEEVGKKINRINKCCFGMRTIIQHAYYYYYCLMELGTEPKALASALSFEPCLYSFYFVFYILFLRQGVANFLPVLALNSCLCLLSSYIF
jgi:hypothetical protein